MSVGLFTDYAPPAYFKQFTGTNPAAPIWAWDHRPVNNKGIKVENGDRVRILLYLPDDADWAPNWLGHGEAGSGQQVKVMDWHDFAHADVFTVTKINLPQSKLQGVPPVKSRIALTGDVGGKLVKLTCNELHFNYTQSQHYPQSSLAWVPTSMGYWMHIEEDVRDDVLRSADWINVAGNGGEVRFVPFTEDSIDPQKINQYGPTGKPSNTVTLH